MDMNSSDKNNQKQSAEIQDIDMEHLKKKQDEDLKKDEEEEIQQWQRQLMVASEFRRNNQPEKAVQIIQQLIEIIPKNQKETNKFAVTHYLLAEAYRSFHLPTTADKIERAYKMSIQLDPDFSQAYRELANFYVQENQLRKAIKAYQEWAQKYPQNGEIYTKIGDLYAEAGLYQQSMKYRFLAMRKGSKGKAQRYKFSKQDEQDMIIYGP